VGSRHWSTPSSTPFVYSSGHLAFLVECSQECVAAFLDAVSGDPLPEASLQQALASVVRLVPRLTLEPDEERRRCAAISPLLLWIEAVLSRHANSAAVVEHCFFLLRRMAWASEDKAAFLPVVPSGLVALGLHRAVPAVAEHALVAFTNIAEPDAAKVRQSVARAAVCCVV
jgi:hypothetical protein